MADKNSIVHVPGYNGKADLIGIFDLTLKSVTQIPEILENVWQKALRNAGLMLDRAKVDVDAQLKYFVNDLDPAGNPKVPPLNTDTIIKQVIASYDNISETDTAFKCVREYFVNGTELMRWPMQEVEAVLLNVTSHDYIVEVGKWVYQELIVGFLVDMMGNAIIGEEGMASLKAVATKVAGFIKETIQIDKWMKQLNDFMGREDVKFIKKTPLLTWVTRPLGVMM